MAAAQPPLVGQSLRDLRDEMLAKDPAFRAAWEAAAPRRRLVSALVRLRRKADLTQQELATRAGWDRAVVSRLESLPRDSESLALPDLATLARYADACGSALGLVFGQPSARPGELEVTAAASLSDDERFTRTLATWPAAASASAAGRRSRATTAAGASQRRRHFPCPR